MLLLLPLPLLVHAPWQSPPDQAAAGWVTDGQGGGAHLAGHPPAAAVHHPPPALPAGPARVSHPPAGGAAETEHCPQGRATPGQVVQCTADSATAQSPLWHTCTAVRSNMLTPSLQQQQGSLRGGGAAALADRPCCALSVGEGRPPLLPQAAGIKCCSTHGVVLKNTS